MLLKKKRISTKLLFATIKKPELCFSFVYFLKMASVSTRKHLDLLIIVICGVANVTKF